MPLLDLGWTLSDIAKLPECSVGAVVTLLQRDYILKEYGGITDEMRAKQPHLVEYHNKYLDELEKLKGPVIEDGNDAGPD